MKRFTIFFIATIALLASCGVKQRSLGDQHYQLFTEQRVNFTDSLPSDSSVLRLASGRMLLTKVSLPSYEKEVRAFLEVHLQSAGDPWDKSGSLFVIPNQSLINFRSIASGWASFPDSTSQHPGIVAGEDYLPVVELMRFMTPFGVGYYSDKIKEKPVYIPNYENEVVWKQEITDRLPLLEGEVWIGVWIDTWTDKGYQLTASLHFDESDAINYPKKQRRILPLTNTVAYGFGQELPDFFAQEDLTIPFSLPADAHNVQLHYITTGHGGHSGGDEFTEQVNVVSLDGREILNFKPWRNDCASFRRFNPSTAVWLQKDEARYFDDETGQPMTKEIEERIASSDLSRSNWCPGSDVPPVVVDLGSLTSGSHELTISIPNAQPASEGALNHWLVSAYLTWQE